MSANHLTAKQHRTNSVEVLIGKDNGWVTVNTYMGLMYVEVYDRNGNPVHVQKLEWPEAPKRKFKVRASYQAMCETEIEANSLDEAYELAKELDGSSFDTHCDPDDWHIEDVWETER
jgi:hypothetical protein